MKPETNAAEALGAVTANPQQMRWADRARTSFDRPKYKGLAGALEFAAGVTAPIPIAGDVFGFANDVNQMRINPEQRTLFGLGMAALGALPLVPSGLGRASKGIDSMTDLVKNARMTPKQTRESLLSAYKELAEQNPYAYFGARVVGPDQSIVAGQKLKRSSKWVDGRPLSSKLPGTAVFELRPHTAENAIDHALSYNLGSRGQKIAIVMGDNLGKNAMPEAFSALIKSPTVTHVFERPEELLQVTRAEELKKLLSRMP